MFRYFSTQEATLIQPWLNFVAEYRTGGVVMLVAAMTSMMMVAWAAKKWSEGKTALAITGLGQIILGWAVTVPVEASGGSTVSVLFEAAVAKFADVPAGYIHAWAEKNADGFTVTGSQFPLKARIASDYGTPLATSSIVTTQQFAQECLLKEVTGSLNASDEAQAITHLGMRTVWLPAWPPPGNGKDCKTWGTDIETVVTNWKGGLSNFAVRRSLAREMGRAAVLTVDVAPVEVPEDMRVFLQGSRPVEDRWDVAWASRLVGEATGIMTSGFVMMPILVQLPAGLINLVLYTVGLGASRSLTYFAHRAHEVDLSCISKLNSADTDISLHPVHAFNGYFVRSNTVDRAYESLLKTCLKEKEENAGRALFYGGFWAVLLGTGFAYAQWRMGR